MTCKCCFSSLLSWLCSELLEGSPSHKGFSLALSASSEVVTEESKNCAVWQWGNLLALYLWNTSWLEFTYFPNCFPLFLFICAEKSSQIKNTVWSFKISKPPVTQILWVPWLNQDKHLLQYVYTQQRQVNESKLLSRIQLQHKYILSQQIPMGINAQALWTPEWLILSEKTLSGV